MAGSDFVLFRPFKNLSIVDLDQFVQYGCTKLRWLLDIPKLNFRTGYLFQPRKEPRTRGIIVLCETLHCNRDSCLPETGFEFFLLLEISCSLKIHIFLFKNHTALRPWDGKDSSLVFFYCSFWWWLLRRHWSRKSQLIERKCPWSQGSRKTWPKGWISCIPVSVLGFSPPPPPPPQVYCTFPEQTSGLQVCEF